MKNNKGVTLLEVIVSIVILGITIVSTIQVMASNNRLVIKNERGLNSIQEIESIMEIFTSDPEKFKDNIKEIYEVDLDITKYLYYSSAFIKSSNNEPTDYYLEVNYSKSNEGNKYTLIINTYYKNTLYTHSNNNYNERVIVK